MIRYFHYDLGIDFHRQTRQFKGFSVRIEKLPNGTLDVSHTFCGRNEKQFSKKLARQALAHMPIQNITVKELPEYLGTLYKNTFKKDLDWNGTYSSWNGTYSSKFTQYCWRFV